ncbi:hypothetical protein DFQ14_10585 [Halopolyspora algeriensis]|uniref:Uncharacterized protein n=1 Tax=Halopolyspora algeriensis TaxID=1500506 RepID=A0A368VQK8_9ACTN|nr:hypothetical protein [Halopolyspora algeriensis]RCW43940.1 hypothetical protein DFQ14_10585 [Halopolyspora algeriensis]TQM53557.1 hypothetical protein FHU43_1714 [Halopolyspora algeriensis]
MKGYSVHLLFHILATVVGVACGTAAALWLFDHMAVALWILLGALLLGILVLAAQALYIRGNPGERSRPRQARTGSAVRTGTRPDLPADIGQEPGTARSEPRNHR